MDTHTLCFYIALCAMTLINLLLTVKQARTVKFSATSIPDHCYQKNMFMLAIPFILECGYRSILPRVDIPRLCFLDVWPNVVLLGRLSAFVGEWCWMLQISMALQKLLSQTPLSPSDGLTTAATFAARALPYICLLAECFGTAGPTTTNAFWCIIEAVTWTTMFAIAGGAALVVRRNLKAMNTDNLNVHAATVFSNGLVLVALVYVPYMIAFNIPLYVDQYKADGGKDGAYLSFKEGLPDVASCHEQSFTWEDWSDDAGWMLGYFGPAVWTSIWLMGAPMIAEGEGLQSKLLMTTVA